ncbi:MAG: hypothetical protein HDQ44_01635 [Desulfovibrio sp.]|nr:hypothetical protein [Desulfovibrio sp.]
MLTRFFLLLFLLMASVAQAQSYQPGFRTFGAWQEDPQMRLDINVWYPATRQAKELNYPPWLINAALQARPAEGRFPLLVISHASPADRFSYHNLAEYLAKAGFVVVAPTHGHDCMNNMDDLFTWRQLERRATEINASLELISREKDLAAIIDQNRIGMIGFGSGATTALLLGGALPNCAGWPAYCGRAGKNDAYCSPWAIGRMDGLCQELPLKKSLADQRIKAIAAISPGFGMLFDAQSFTHFHPPLLLVDAGREQFNRPKFHCEPLARLIGSRARYLDLPGADAGSLIAPCSQALAEELPELCLSVPAEEKAAIQAKLASTLLAFFRHFLVITPNLPRIPAPPELTQPAAQSLPALPKTAPRK